MLRHALTAAVTVAALALTPSVAAAANSGNMSFVANFPYEARNGTTPNYGTDIEFARVGGRQYALAGSYRNGLQIFDVTQPEQTQRVAVYDCGVTQGDVQVFRQADKPGRVFASYASDTYGDGTSTCYREAEALGFSVHKANGTGKNGTFILEITDPSDPRTVSFVEVAQGSHNQTIHPSGRYLYNSNADLITSVLPAIEVFDIGDFAAPRQVAELDLPTRPGLGTESHDITFRRDGTRAYSAALSQGVVIDTTDPADPRLVSSFVDPSINVWHQSDPFSVRDRSGRTRDFLLVEDEFAGAAGGPVCPSGGFHVFEVTGALERDPAKVGYWNIDEVRTTTDPTQTCTAHVFRVHEREKLMTVAFYNGGVRVVDLSGLEGISLGDSSLAGEGMREIGFYRHEDADTWSAKTPRIDPRTGDFYLFGNDIARGLDVYRFDGEGRRSGRGRWMSPAEGRTFVATRTAGVQPTPDTSLFCLLGR